MTIYVSRNYHEEYRSWAAAGDVPMLDGIVARTVPEHDARKILQSVPPPSKGSVTDIGCGSATLLRKIADDPKFAGCALNGILPSAEEVALTRALCDEQVGPNRIFIGEGSAISTGIPPSSQDCVYMNQMFHYLTPETAPNALAEVFRILRPGGIIFIGGLPDQDEFAHLEQAETAWSLLWKTVTTPPILRRTPAALARVLRYAVTRRGFLLKLQTPFFATPMEFTTSLATAGFTAVTVARYTMVGPDGSDVEHVCRWDYTATRPAVGS